MKSVFVYYSMTGNGDYVAEQLKKKGVDIIKLQPKRRLPKAMLPQMMVGGMLALFHHKAKLMQDEFNLTEYEKVIIGTPIWNQRVSTPVNTLLAKNTFTDKVVMLVAYSGGGEANQCQEYVSKKYGIQEFISLRQPLKNKDEVINILDKRI